MAACEPSAWESTRQPAHRGGSPGACRSGACAPVTCERRCAQACAFPKCVPRTVSACGSRWRTGGTRAHGQAAGAHLRTGVSTRRQVRGEPNLRLRAPSQAGKGSGSGGGLEAGAGTSAPAQMSAAARAGVPTAKAHPASQGLPHPCVPTHRPGEGHRPGSATSSSLLCQGHIQHSTPQGRGAGSATAIPWP